MRRFTPAAPPTIRTLRQHPRVRASTPYPPADRRRRLGAQLLAGRPARSAAAVAARLLAVQAQNLRAGRLAVRARTRGLTAAAVNAELERRDVVIGWSCRGTLHLMLPDDYPWLLGLSAPTQRTGNLRRLHECGYAPDRARAATDLVVRMLGSEGPLARAAIGARLEEAGYAVNGQALVHILFLASYDGRIVRGPFRGAEQAFVRTRDWLGAEPVPLTPERRPAALGELARRYLAGHGPASASDLALWAGLPLRDAQAGLRQAAGSIVAAGAERFDIRERPPVPRRLPPRLLPAFDAYLLGWADRAYGVPSERVAEIRLGGMIRAVALLEGRAVGTWAARRSGRRIAVEIEEWGEIPPAARAGLDAEAADVVRFETGAPPVDET
jgi:Winged helix DNA-binding domain